MIEIKDKRNCCGCGSCSSICPKSCVSMKPDEEGFLYPSVDRENCINCGLCVKVCPILNRKEEQEKEQKAFLVQHVDDVILRESTSGGAFTAIATSIIEKGGVVFGASLNENFECCHTFVESVSGLSKFRNSKYVQSKIGNSFVQTKKFLKEGRFVCFSGTPCQVEGLLAFLGTDYENLIIVDVVCRACPSPKVLEKYLNVQSSQGDLRKVLFRNKYYGYKYSTLSLFRDLEGDYHEGIDTDVYLRAFFSNLSVRPSCYSCAFKKRYRLSDLTIWDCFDVYKYSNKLNNDKGVTKVLVQSEKGLLWLELAKKYLNVQAVIPDDLIKGNREMFNSVSYNSKREQFFEELNQMEPRIVFEKYFPITFRHRIEKKIRLFCIRWGVYSFAKMMFNKVRGQREIER